MIEQGHLESLTEAMVVQHAQLAGLAQGTAEEYYILGAQQLDNYGQETFFAKVRVQTGMVTQPAYEGKHKGFWNLCWEGERFLTVV